VYGHVEKGSGFICIAPIPVTTKKSNLVLLFTLAKGDLPTLLKPSEDFPDQNTKSYAYHILCSTTLETGPNWYPPVEKETKEEVEKLLQARKNTRASILNPKRKPR